MIVVNNKEFRNLEEQVLKNQADISAMNGLQGSLGIHVVGAVEHVGDLPDPETYEGEYGDAYLVGEIETEEPQVLYIFTRPVSPVPPYDSNWWFGPVTLEGTQGPQGPKGDKGDPGEPGAPGQDGVIGRDGFGFYYCRTNNITSDVPVFDKADITIPTGATIKIGDWVVTPNGRIYTVYIVGDVSAVYPHGYVGCEWRTTIQGAKGEQGEQGPQGIPGQDGERGPQGEKGDVGGFINIKGIINTSAELPEITDHTAAYLVGTSTPYTLYIVVGTDDPYWSNQGPLNVATLVTSGGEYQNLWNADTKLDKQTTTQTSFKAYVFNNSGQSSMNISSDNVGSSIVRRDTAGYIFVADPTNNSHAANKLYVDDALIEAKEYTDDAIEDIDTVTVVWHDA